MRHERGLRFGLAVMTWLRFTEIAVLLQLLILAGVIAYRAGWFLAVTHDMLEVVLGFKRLNQSIVELQAMTMMFTYKHGQS